jgi:L-histidine Nalpha-methyltransferase
MPDALTRPDLFEETRRSLEREPKELSPVWLYDERGSRLYEEITRLPGYYLPRAEAEILRSHAAEIARRTEARTLVELGSGNARNTRFLLDALEGTLERFAPVDVSAEILRETAGAIAAAYPRIAVQEIVGDFQRGLGALPGRSPRLVAFLGSTIGNFYPEQREELLASLGDELGDREAILLGLDLVKDPARLEAAYHDETGETETFARNALTAVNRELDATFDQRRFAYEPRWDPEHEWMDIAFRAVEEHAVSVRRLGLELRFETGERLRIEISAKFRRDRFEAELEGAGLGVASWWTDPAGDFAVVLARPEGQVTRREET